jgi:ribosome-binding factor A
MASRRQIQVSESIAHLASEFLARNLGGTSLVTVTRAELSPDFKDVTVFLSVLPHTSEETVLKDAKRARSDFRQFVLDHSFLQHVPTIDFEIDYGEKNRQRVDDLTRRK